MASTIHPSTQRWNCQIKHSFAKRFFDIAFSCLAITFLSPIYVIIACAIKATSKGNVFYSQERIGRGGQPFRCLKFRTMFPNAEDRLNQLLQENSSLRQEWNETQKLKNDPRVTPIGMILRKTSLDELPQFWNVLRGDLSVVGPRPILAEEIARHYGVKAEKILSIRPGVTGLWQVSGRNNTSYSARVMLDETYVDKRNLLLDLKVIAKTVPCMINSKGAY